MTFFRTMLVAISLCLGTGALAAPSAWKISELSGQVTVGSATSSKPGQRGQSVATGDTLETGRDGRVVLVRDRDFVIVAPGSKIRVGEPAGKSRLVQMIQIIGKAAYAINKRLTPDFEVRTPNLAAVVKGTRFDVTVTPDGCSVSVSEGRVEVQTADGGAHFMAHRGDTGTIMSASRNRIDVTGAQTNTVVSPHAQPMMPKPTMSK